MADSTRSARGQLGASAGDPLSDAYIRACVAGRTHYESIGSADRTHVDIGAGLRAILWSPLDYGGPILGVHNQSASAQGFTVDQYFPDVVAGLAHLLFVGGQVETTGSADEPTVFRLQPGAHVWIAQASNQGMGGTSPDHDSSPTHGVSN
ncbi:hypothetical protein [Spongiactinospora gelatinilytica]|uniref:hypothetical protein n=1 Tax=Spongiactinospora gelatinilytica TaxID=2666298 RepID=UPI0011B94B66|nr:hypothetical protein [Spongiactinospora gelatinilytica]